MNLIKEESSFRYNYNRYPDGYPTTQFGKEAAIEQSRIFWSMTPDFVRAADPFPNTPEGLKARNEYLHDFWQSVGRQPLG